ncbi:MAG: OprO/OprP family phosphate-selective porin [Hyphomonadaceae bacterium]
MNIRTAALLGASWLAFAGAAAAQEAQTPEDAAARIQQLEERLAALEAQLTDLKESTSADAADVRRIQTEAPQVQLQNGRPTIRTADGDSFAIRGLVQFDAAHYFDNDDNAAGTDLASGTNFRRARLGVEGTAFRNWNYNLTGEFGGSASESAQLNQAWIEYAGWKPFDNLSPLRLRVGAWATAANLEDATNNTESLFLERPAAAELVRAIAAGDGRTGVGAFLNGDRWYGSAVLTGAVIGAPTTAEFDEQTGYLTRLAFLPLRGETYGLHLGANVSGVIDVADTGAGPTTTQGVRLRERPELRVDGTRFVDTGNIPADSVFQYGLEIGGFWKNFYAAAEYIDIEVARTTAGLADPSFTGWYVQGAWALTGERRQWSAANGGFQGIRPTNNFNPAENHWGAWEIAARYSVLDLNDNEGQAGFATPAGGIRGGEQTITTVGLNWHPNRTIRFLLDYQWVEIERLNGAGANIGTEFDVLSLRSQLAF